MFNECMENDDVLDCFSGFELVVDARQAGSDVHHGEFSDDGPQTDARLDGHRGRDRRMGMVPAQVLERQEQECTRLEMREG